MTTSRPDEATHVPVMVTEVVQELITDRDGIYVDATVGGGGHAKQIMSQLSPKGRVLGLDRDPAALARAQEHLGASAAGRVTLVHADYADLAGVCRQQGIDEINGALFDLGLSSLQLEDAGRGFGYSAGGPLDLRFDPTQGAPVSEWLNRARVEDIARVLKEYGEEPKARVIARRIESARSEASIQTARQLWDILSRTVGSRMPLLGRTAARVWQALRIQVNGELNSIPVGLNAAIDALVDGGRVVVIAYHSLEDRIVKDLFREASRICNCPPAYPRCICGANPRGHLVHRRVVRPSESEVAANSRARSARLRVFEKGALKIRRGAA